MGPFWAAGRQFKMGPISFFRSMDKAPLNMLYYFGQISRKGETAMPIQVMVLSACLDSTLAHAVLAAYLFAILDERSWRQLKKLPALLPSPLVAGTLNVLLYYAFPGEDLIRFWVGTLSATLGCTLWTRWAWRLGFWRALSAVSMAGIFQVALSALTQFLFSSVFIDNAGLQFAAVIAITCAIVLLCTALLYRLGFGRRFRLLLEEGPSPRRMALLLYSLACVIEAAYLLHRGVHSEFFALYYLMVLAAVGLAAGLVLYLAQWLDAARKMEAQRDVIVQQQLYERDLEAIRREVRTFRHDYKNLLAGLSEQADEGELDQLRAALSELDAGFDRRIGEKIRASTQLGNVRVPQVRSLLLSKLAAMGQKGIDCRLEALYPVETVGMDVWDFTRCLGILLDNAAEAALETDTPWVEIVLLSQKGRLSLRVSNPYAGTIEPDKIWAEGFSTKGEGRGLGLAGYQRILAGYANAASSTSWAEGVFVQELTVEDRA